MRRIIVKVKGMLFGPVWVKPFKSPSLICEEFFWIRTMTREACLHACFFVVQAGNMQGTEVPSVHMQWNLNFKVWFDIYKDHSRIQVRGTSVWSSQDFKRWFQEQPSAKHSLKRHKIVWLAEIDKVPYFQLIECVKDWSTQEDDRIRPPPHCFAASS